MKPLKEISEKSLGISGLGIPLGSNYNIRKSTSAMVLNGEGKIEVHFIRKEGE